MRFCLLAFHYPHPQHRDELVERIARASAVMSESPECLSVSSWLEEDGDAVVASAVFTSKDACLAAFGAAAERVDIAEDEREVRPRDVYYLVEAATTRAT